MNPFSAECRSNLSQFVLYFILFSSVKCYVKSLPPFVVPSANGVTLSRAHDLLLLQWVMTELPPQHEQEVVQGKPVVLQISHEHTFNKRLPFFVCVCTCFFAHAHYIFVHITLHGCLCVCVLVYL